MHQALRRWMIVVVAAVVMSSGWALTAYAADPALTVTQKKNFDQTLSEADAQTQGKLKQQYANFESLMKSSKDLNQKIIAINEQNSVKESTLRKQIQKIDEAKLARLKAEAEQTKAKYQQLLDLHTAVNQQLKAAQKLKNKTLITLYQTQSDALKIPVQLAKQAIKDKETAYQNAKKQASEKMKKIRDTLSDIDPLKAQIRSAKSSLKSPKDSRSTSWKSFTSTLTKTHRNPKSAATLLTSVNDSTRQIIQLQQKIYNLESKISDILRKAESQLASA